MIKVYSALVLFFLSCFHISSAQQVLAFSFTGSNGDEATWSSSSQGAGVQSSFILRSPDISAALADDGFNSANWTTNSSLNQNEYIEFAITPAAGYAITFSNIMLQFRRSSKAPRSFVIRTSLDGYAADATNVVNRTDVNTLQTSTFTFTSFITTSSPITIRIYAYDAANTNNSWGPGQSSDGNDIVVSGAMTILPVNFANVRAVQKNNGVAINWTNLTESDVSYYAIEWSANGQSFTELARVNPVQNNYRGADYNFFDTHPLSQINFYRIKAVETTGHLVYSSILKIETGVTNRALAIYPNPAPAGSQVAIQVGNMPAGNYLVRVYNASAQLMHSQAIAVSGGASTQTLPLSNWKKGLYVLEISGAVNLKKQFIVQ